MRHILFLTIALSLSSFSFAQSRQDLKTQVEYCRYHVQELEQEVDVCKSTEQSLLEEITALKMEINAMKKQLEKKNALLSKLQLQNEDLLNHADKLLRLGSRLKKNKDYDSAIEVFNYIIAYYPDTLEAEAAKTQLHSMK